MTNNERIIKVFTLILESEDLQKRCSGICSTINALSGAHIISLTQYKVVTTFIERFEKQYIKKSSYPWYWERWDWKSRRRWLKRQIKNLSK